MDQQYQLYMKQARDYIDEFQIVLKGDDKIVYKSVIIGFIGVYGFDALYDTTIEIITKTHRFPSVNQIVKVIQKRKRRSIRNNGFHADSSNCTDTAENKSDLIVAVQTQVKSYDINQLQNNQSNSVRQQPNQIPSINPENHANNINNVNNNINLNHVEIEQ